jgi:hypothetical protein
VPLYKLTINARGYKAGQVLEINPNDPGWRPWVANGWLVEMPVEESPVRQAVPRPVTDYDATLSAEGG